MTEPMTAGRLRLPGLMLLALALGACAAPVPPAQNDPWETGNRKVHAFNKGLDQAIFGRVEGVSPGTEEFLIHVSNVSNNLSLPGKVLNSLLQGRPEPAVKNTFRFAINTTLGLGGIFDPAGESFALPETDTDFGETLHVWGAPEGPYVELPVIGPSTGRDTAGRVVDFLIDPFDTASDAIRSAKSGFRVASKVGERLRFDDTVDSILYESADSYAQMKLLYLQKRHHDLGIGTGATDYDPYDDPYADFGSFGAGPAAGPDSADAGLEDPYAAQ